MLRLCTILALLFSICAVLGSSAPVLAQTLSPRTWVSGVGDDGNACTQTAPCKTFAGALSKTAISGQISCLDEGDFAAVAITKSVTIDCRYILATVGYAATAGIAVSFDDFASGDTEKTVRLRGLALDGGGLGTIGIKITGGNSLNSAVFVDDVVIEGNVNNTLPSVGYTGAGRGIFDSRSGGGDLFVTNTIVQNNGDAGIAVAPASGHTTIDVSIHNVLVQNCNAGLYIGAGVQAMVSSSNFSGNVNAGLQADVGGILVVDESVSSANGSGVVATQGTPNGIVRLSNSDVGFNNVGASGSIDSFTTNRLSNNTGVLSKIGNTSTPTGQQ